MTSVENDKQKRTQQDFPFYCGNEGYIIDLRRCPRQVVSLRSLVITVGRDQVENDDTLNPF